MEMEYFIDLHNRGDHLPEGVVKFLIKDTGLLFIIQKWIAEEKKYGAIKESYLKKYGLKGTDLANQIFDEWQNVKTDITVKDGIMSLSKGRGTLTKNGDFGASVLMFQDELIEAADQLAPRTEPIVVLPLTRNQIVMQVQDRPIEEINAMIKRINQKQDPELILEDHCYRLDRRTGHIYVPKWEREVW